jgi:bloom syndrome protein
LKSRDQYQGLGQLREDYPTVPIIALTATANQCTREDIVNQLKLRDHAFFTQSFNRPNLKYFIRAKKKKNMLPDIVNFIKKEHPNHTGVIYCLARNSCEQLAEQLRNEGVAADFFHAGLSKEEKNRLLESWKADKFHVMVATVNTSCDIFLNSPSTPDRLHSEWGLTKQMVVVRSSLR